MDEHEIAHQEVIELTACLKAILTKGGSLGHVRFLAMVGLSKALLLRRHGRKVTMAEAEAMARQEMIQKSMPELHPEIAEKHQRFEEKFEYLRDISE